MWYVLAILLPPLVAFTKGTPGQGWLNVGLTVLGWIPGTIHAGFLVYKASSYEPGTGDLTPFMLDDDDEVQVVGESRYQDSLERLAGPKRERGKEHDCIATLIPEPSNRHDKNAVMIAVQGLTEGYLSRPNAKVYQPKLLSLQRRGYMAQCRATIRGGWRDKTSEVHFGIVLMLPEPKDMP